MVYLVLVITGTNMVASCHPLAEVRNTDTLGHCTLIIPMLANSICNVALNTVLLLASMPILSKWGVSSRMRFLTGVFAAGSLTSIVRAVRIYLVPCLLHTVGVAHAMIIPISLSVVEADLSVICEMSHDHAPFRTGALPLLLGFCSKRTDQAQHRSSAQAEPSTVLEIAVEYRANVSDGYDGINSSAGSVLDQRSSMRINATTSTTTKNLKRGRKRDWCLQECYVAGNRDGKQRVKHHST